MTEKDDDDGNSSLLASDRLQDRRNWQINLKRELDLYSHVVHEDGVVQHNNNNNHRNNNNHIHGHHHRHHHHHHLQKMSTDDDLIQRQSNPDNYLVTPHRKRRLGFNNSPSQNPFSPSYIDEISFIHHRYFHPLPIPIPASSSSAPPYLADCSTDSPNSPGRIHNHNNNNNTNNNHNARRILNTTTNVAVGDDPHLLNSVEELVVKCRPPSEDRLTAHSPERSPYQADSTPEAVWPTWNGPASKIAPFYKTAGNANFFFLIRGQINRN